MGRFEDLEDKFNDAEESQDGGLNAGSLGYWQRPERTTTPVAYMGDRGPGEPKVGDTPAPPSEPPRPGSDAPTDKPPTPPPTGEKELPKVTDEQRRNYLRDNPQVAADVRAMADYLKPIVRKSEYENETIYNDISNGLGSSRMKEMLRRATEKGPQEVALFIASINHALDQNPATKGMKFEANFKTITRPDNREQDTCEFTLKRPGKTDDKWNAEAPQKSYAPAPGRRGDKK